MFRLKSISRVLLVIIICLITLFLSSKINTVNPKILIGFLLIISFVILFFIIKPIKISNVLLLSCFFFIKPFYSTIYFIIIIMILTSFIDNKHSNKQATFPYLIFFLILIISTIIGLSKSYVFSEGLFYSSTSTLIPLILMIIISNADIDHNDIQKILKAFVIIAFIVAFVGIIIAIKNPDARIGSLWITAMTINAFYLIGFFISLALSFDAKTITQKLLYLFFAVIIFLGILATYTRMALLAAVFGIVLMVLRIKQFRKYSLFLVMLIPLVIPASLHERLSMNISEDLSMIYRFIAWFRSIKLIQDNFWFGIGINNFMHIYPRYVPSDSMILIHPHNIILRYWLELGFFGLISYFAIIISIIYKFFKHLKKNNERYLYQAMLISILVILFACITDVFISQLYIALIFWMILAFMEKIVQMESR